jgi:tetratricopeptide (TPR) repeat protein
MNIGSLQSAIGNHPEALATYDRLLSQFSETSIVLDRARFASGEIYQFHIRDKALAIQQYERLLVDYPQSLFLEETRKRIRQLRGEVF